MTDAHPDNTYVDNEIDLRELFLVLWEGKVLITIVTGLAAIVSVVVALSCRISISQRQSLRLNLTVARWAISPCIPVWWPGESCRYKPRWARGRWYVKAGNCS